MRNPLVGCAALTLSLFPGVHAVSAAELLGEARTVVELFTSQGCPFSPDADLIVAAIADRGDVVALTYHVDYWDYAGWKDTFGNSANSDLQRDYAELWGTSKLYTPQLVVGGSTAIPGLDEPATAKAIEENGLTRTVQLTSAGDTLRIVVPGQVDARPSTVWIVTYIEQSTVLVRSGYNAGKALSYDHIVTSRSPLAFIGAGTGTQLSVKLGQILREPATGLAVLVQEDLQGLPGPITGASLYER